MSFSLSSRVRTCALSLALVGVSAMASLEAAPDTSAWSNIQTISIDKTGPIKLALPYATLDSARDNLADLRIIGPDGEEIPYAIPRPARAPASFSPAWQAPSGFQVTHSGDTTTLLIETGTDQPLEYITLDIPDTADFLKTARVDISNDGRTWTTLASGQPLFRRNQNSGYSPVLRTSLSLRNRTASNIRIAISGQATAPIVVTGAKLRIGETRTPETPQLESSVETVPGVRIVQTEQIDGETILTVDFGAAHLRLDEVEIDTSDPIFIRQASLWVPENKNGQASEVRLSLDQAIYRIALDDAAPASQTRIGYTKGITPARELRLHIRNNDSPPLKINAIRATASPVYIAFNASAAGTYQLFSGNPRTTAPSYDLAAFATQLSNLPVTSPSVGAIAANPNYREPAPEKSNASDEAMSNQSIFWLALAVAVVVLLYVVTRMLPRKS